MAKIAGRIGDNWSKSLPKPQAYMVTSSCLAFLYKLLDVIQHVREY